MCHHKAPHRPWQPDDKHFTLYDEDEIPEPGTFRDDYSMRTDAAHETTMTIAHHLTRTDLKADPPPGLSGDALLKWKYQRFIKDYLRCVASIDDNVGRLLDFLDKTGLAGTPSSSTRATRDSSLATTAGSISGSCTSNRSVCRS